MRCATRVRREKSARKSAETRADGAPVAPYAPSAWGRSTGEALPRSRASAKRGEHDGLAAAVSAIVPRNREQHERHRDRPRQVPRAEVVAEAGPRRDGQADQFGAPRVSLDGQLGGEPAEAHD